MATLLQEFLQQESSHNASLATSSRTSSRRGGQRRSTINDGSHSDSSSNVTLQPDSCGRAPHNSSSSISHPVGHGIFAKRTVARQAYTFAVENVLNGEEEEELGVAVASIDVEAHSNSVSQHCKHSSQSKPLSLLPSSSSSRPPVASDSMSTSSSFSSSCCPPASPSSSSSCSAASSSSFSLHASPSVSSHSFQNQHTSRNSSNRNHASSKHSSNGNSHSDGSDSSMSEKKQRSNIVVSVDTSAELHAERLLRKKRQKPFSSFDFSSSSSSPSTSSFPSSSRPNSFSLPPSFSFVPCAAAASLPVLRYASAIVKAVQQHQVTLIVGETGSGKTTQIPQLMHAAGFTTHGMIGITQPRRVAAVSLAARVADEILIRRKEQQKQQQHMQQEGQRQTQQQLQQCRGEVQHWKHQQLKQPQHGDAASQECPAVEVEEEKTYETEKKKRINGDVYHDKKDVNRQRSLTACSESEKYREKGFLTSTAASCSVQQDTKAATGAVARTRKEETLLGRLVGYAVRFEDVSSSETRIKYMTDGLLLREAIRDPLLLQYSLLIIDEAHERSVRSDVLLGYIKLLLQKQERNKDLRLIVMSATLETKKFLTFFPQAKLLVVPGRSFPLDILHAAEPQEDYVEAALVAAMQIHLSSSPGDILVFLPGQEDIEALNELLLEKRRLLRSAAAVAMNRGCAEAYTSLSSVAVLPSAASAARDASHISSSVRVNGVTAVDAEQQQPVRICVSIGEQEYIQQLPLGDIVVCPLYAALPFDQQKAIFDPAPAGSRKIILATNIAETSITVQGIRFVIDSGLVKTKVVHHRSGIEALVVREISKESAAQRAGRAAREARGVVYRLYTDETFQKFKTHRQPEIVSSDLGQIFLELKALRITNPLEFPFLDPPSAEAFFNAGRTLHRIGALDARGDLTAVGRQLSALPLSPLLGKLLLESVRLECSAEILIIVAMLSTDSLWNNSRVSSAHKTTLRLSDARRQIIIEQSDHLTLLNAYKKWDEASDKHAFCREYGMHFNAMRRAAQIRQQLEELLKSPHVGAKEIKEGGPNDNWALVRQCLAAGCWLNTARLQRDGSSYVTTVQRLVAKLHPSSVLFGKAPLPGYIVYSEYVQTTKPYLRCVTAIEGNWLQQLVPRWFSAVENVV